MRCISASLLALPLLAAPALSQNVVVVPAGSEMVIPPRGAAPPPGQPVARARPNLARPQPRAVTARESGGQMDGGMGLSGAPLTGGMGLAAPALIALPLAAAAAFAAGSLPGGGGGTTAPARTR
jgi:hypothetical protein